MDLSRLRDVMMDSRSLWRTFRARGTEWRDHDLLTEAFMRQHPPGAHSTFVTGTIDEPPDEVQPWSLWIELPDNIRVEFEGGHEHTTAVFRGTTWWSVSPSSPPITNDGNPRSGHGMGPGYPLTDPRRLVFALDLEPHKGSTFAGRPVVHVSATPFDHSRADLMEQLAFDDAASGLGTGADRYELVVDTERGVVLRSEAQLEGSPFLIIEIQDVGFDEPFPNDTFTLEAPPGQTFKNSSELFGWRDELEDDP